MLVKLEAVDGADKRLAKLRGKLASVDKMGAIVVDATKVAVQDEYHAGFETLRSPWGDTWEPARFSKGKAPGYLSGDLATTPVEKVGSMSGVSFGGVKIRQDRYGGIIQAGGPLPGGSGDPDSKAFDSRGTTRGTLPWDFGSKWDTSVEAGFKRTVENWFSGV